VASFNVAWPLLAHQTDLETYPSVLISSVSIGLQTLFSLDARSQRHLSASHQYEDLASAWAVERMRSRRLRACVSDSLAFYRTRSMVLALSSPPLLHRCCWCPLEDGWEGAHASSSGSEESAEV
jgi:hypothetical protein